MESKSVSVNVMLNAEIFRKFALFNNLYLRRRWISPVVFASIMSAFACVCFAIRGSAAQAVMLGCVLILIGWGFPAVYLWTFLNSIKSQIKIYKLEKPQLAYSLRLSNEPDGVKVTNPVGEFAKYEWRSIYGVYRVAGCTYLYVVSNKAFLLPDGQVDEGIDVLWTLLADMLPPEKLYDCRRIKK